MFYVIDMCETIWPCYGTFIDESGDVQFILECTDGSLIKTNAVPGFYKVYHDKGLEKSINDAMQKSISILDKYTENPDFVKNRGFY